MTAPSTTPPAGPPYDLLLRRAVLRDGTGVDIGIAGSRIVAVAPDLEAPAVRTIDLEGRVVLPGLVEAHTHLDKCLTGELAENRSGTLYEAVDVMGRLQRDRSVETIRVHARQAALLFLGAGVTAIRSHVDINESAGLRGVEALLAVREELAGVLDLQLVALCGGLDDPPRPGVRALAEEALRMGVNAVGGAPALHADPCAYIDVVFELAERYDRPIDLHVDESDDPTHFCLPYLAEKTRGAGYEGRVVAGHCCSLAAVDHLQAERAIEAVRTAGIRVVTLPSCNLYLQGRDDRGIVRRGLTRVRELLAAGVPVSCGSDNVQDPFNPFGNGDLLQVANLLAHAAHFGRLDEQAVALDMITGIPAETLGLADYGLQPGCAADLVVLDTRDPRTILATVPPRRYVLKRGRIVAQTETTRVLDILQPEAGYVHA
jgi:cytosine/creatinine deaminase